MKIQFINGCFFNKYFLSGNKNGINFLLKKQDFHHPSYKLNFFISLGGQQKGYT